MISREWQTVKVYSFSDDIDEYGQKRQGPATMQEVRMVVHTMSITNVDNPKYADIDLIGITEADISDKNQVEIDGIVYNVKTVIPGRKYNQIMMRNE